MLAKAACHHGICLLCAGSCQTRQQVTASAPLKGPSTSQVYVVLFNPMPIIHQRAGSLQQTLKPLRMPVLCDRRVRGTHIHGQRQLQRGACEEHGHKIGVHVACRPPVLIPAGEVLDVRQSPASKLWDGKAVHFLILPLQVPTYCTTCRCMHTNGGRHRASSPAPGQLL